MNKEDIVRSQSDELTSSCHSNISSLSTTNHQIEELKIWCKNPINRRVLEVISFSHESSYYEAISSILFNESAEYSQKEIHRALAEYNNFFKFIIIC